MKWSAARTHAADMLNRLKLYWDGPRDAKHTFAFAHGAGAGCDTPFMTVISQGLAAHGVRVARFEFPYMRRQRAEGGRRPPDREPVLRETWLEVIGQLGREVVIGGKSLGGRIASLVADEAQVAGLACLGYPFHPVGKPDRLRVTHLESLRTPALIVQGERDPFGCREEVVNYSLSKRIQLHWLPDGDHSFKPRRSSGRTLEQNLDAAVAALARFLETH